MTATVWAPIDLTGCDRDAVREVLDSMKLGAFAHLFDEATLNPGQLDRHTPEDVDRFAQHLRTVALLRAVLASESEGDVLLDIASAIEAANGFEERKAREEWTS